MHVYVITNTVNGKLYVGQTIQDPDKYWKYNVRCAILGKQYKPALYGAIRKYGPEAFRMDVVGTAISKDELDNWERLIILVFGTYLKSNGYNLTLGGDGTIGAVRTEEWRRNISQGNMGKTWSAERKIASSISRRGRVLSDEHKKNISDGVRGTKKPERWVASLAERNRLRKGIPLSDARKKAISAGLVGRTVSEETRQKMRNIHSSESVREKKRNSMLATLARKREEAKCLL